jgi:hypothetical protein
MVYCTFDENTHGHVHTHTHAAQEASERDTEPYAVWSKKAGKESEIEKEGERGTGERERGRESACKSEHVSARESERKSKSEVARMRESEGDRVSKETETCQGRRVCPDNKRTGNCA